MRPWIALTLVALAVVASVRHAQGHRHPVLIPLLLVPAVVLGWSEWRFRADERLFSAVAAEIAQADVRMDCQRFAGALVDASGELGYVRADAGGRPGDVGRLERGACEPLRDYAHGDRANPTLDQVIAVQVLAHEAYHLAGLTVEAEAECAAMQRLPDVAGWLGATPTQARALAERYWSEVYPRLPEDYRDGQCRAGGALDSSPADGVWP